MSHSLPPNASSPIRADSPRSARRHAMPWPQKLAVAAAVLFLAILLGTGVGLAVLYRLWHTPPAHWQKYQAWLQATTPQERQALATQLEKTILAQLADLPAGQDTLVIQMTVQQANAWLEQRLPEVLANQDIHLPEGVQGMMVDVEEEDFLLAFHYQTDKVDQVFTLVTQPHFTTGMDGVAKMRFNLQSVRGGRVPIPNGLVNKAAGQADQQGLNKAIESVLATLRGRAIDARVPYPGDKKRMLRVVDLTLYSQTLQVKTRVEAK